MLCVIPNIHRYISDNYRGNHRNQVNIGINICFCDLSDDELHIVPGNFCNEYNYFHYNNVKILSRMLLY